MTTVAGAGPDAVAAPRTARTVPCLPRTALAVRGGDEAGIGRTGPPISPAFRAAALAAAAAQRLPRRRTA